MPQEAMKVHGWASSEIHGKIKLLIDNLVNIKDEDGKFLLKLSDGRVIDTKGWNDWEWSMLKAFLNFRLT
jgi:unsaturated rhamnogalacturonyl hydrolase